MPEYLCPLCQSDQLETRTESLSACGACRGVFRHADFHLSEVEEKNRYMEHNNDVHDPGYRTFVSPITGTILRDYSSSHRGLDFGAGTGPVITRVLRDHGYGIDLYDPFFHPDEATLSVTYDYIACCEVIEHFCRPHESFRLLRGLLKEGGSLYAMTLLFDDRTDFATWYYPKDPTHVFFYRRETIQWISNAFGFSIREIGERLIILEAV